MRIDDGIPEYQLNQGMSPTPLEEKRNEELRGLGENWLKKYREIEDKIGVLKWKLMKLPDW